MARPKKTVAKATSVKKPTAKKTTARKPRAQAKKQTKATAKKPTTAKALPKVKGAGNLTDAIKLLKGSNNTRRPPNNPDIPPLIIGYINADLNQVKSALEEYAQHFRPLDRCQKAYGFLARSLRCAQTPHIYSWSFAKGKTPKLSGVAG